MIGWLALFSYPAAATQLNHTRELSRVEQISGQKGKDKPTDYLLGSYSWITN